MTGETVRLMHHSAQEDISKQVSIFINSLQVLIWCLLNREVVPVLQMSCNVVIHKTFNERFVAQQIFHIV